jgi:hypothetical protein
MGLISQLVFSFAIVTIHITHMYLNRRLAYVLSLFLHSLYNPKVYLFFNIKINEFAYGGQLLSLYHDNKDCLHNKF